MHQLRMHSCVLGTPIVGETKYSASQASVERNAMDTVKDDEDEDEDKEEKEEKKGAGPVKGEKGCGLHLCATRVVFDHPLALGADLQSMRVDVSIDIPRKFSMRLQREQERFDRLSNQVS